MTMKRMISMAAGLMILVMSGGCYTVTGAKPTDAQKADELARSVTQASGANAWPRATSLAFTFVVRDGGELKVSRQHLWNIKAGTDTVSVGEKSMTVNIAKPDMDDPAKVEAFKAWTNDSYWLLAPLKLFDMGVTREYLGQREVAGKGYEALRLSFKGVGMTPGDQYNLYIDPYTNLVAYWDYMPSSEMTMRATWEKYRHVEGLKLATFHQMGTKTIAIENLSVASE
jgi:hypothetical protein